MNTRGTLTLHSLMASHNHLLSKPIQTKFIIIIIFLVSVQIKFTNELPKKSICQIITYNLGCLEEL